MSVLWTRDAAVAATGGASERDWAAKGVSIDTRSLAAGDLFVALKDTRDGHDFVADAFRKGAAAAMVSADPSGIGGDRPLLRVDDTLEGLRGLGRAARGRSAATVVGVTGSVGKTSTKEALAAALGAQGQTHAASASYNNHIGVPLTLARMPTEEERATANAWFVALEQDLAAAGIPANERPAQAWTALARVLFRMNEFLYVD